MQNYTQKPLWEILNKNLSDLKFSTDHINMVRRDLENLIKGEVTLSLLERLGTAQKEEIKLPLEGKNSEEKQKFVSDYIKQAFSDDEINSQITESTQIVIKDYLSNLLDKVDDTRKKQILESIAG